MSTPKKYLEQVKRFAKKGLVVLAAILMVVYSSNISAFAEAAAEYIQEAAAEAVQGGDATTTPEGQTQNDDGQLTTEPTQNSFDELTINISANMATVSHNGQAAGSYINTTNENDLTFTVAPYDGYELTSVKYNGSELGTSGSYTISAAQLSNNSTISVDTAQVQVETGEQTPAAVNIEDEGEGSEDQTTDAETPAATDSAETPAATDSAQTDEPASTESATTDAATTDAATTDAATTDAAQTDEPASTESADTPAATESATTDSAQTDEPASTESATTDAATTEAATTDASDDTENSGSGNFFDNIANWWNGLTGGTDLTSITADSKTIAVGSTTTLTTSHSKKSHGNHSWKSNNTSVATVSGNGKTATVTGVSAGTTTIEYGYYSGLLGWTWNKCESVTIKVTDSSVAATKLELPETASAKRGETLNLKNQATVEPSNAKITWSSSDTSVATVNSNGVVTGVKPGTVTIVAQSGSLVDSTEVTVTANTTGDNVKSANFYFATSPSAIVASNETYNWEWLGSIYPAVDLTGATWVDGTNYNAKNTFDVANRIIQWPDGSTGSTYTIAKGSSAWNHIYNAWKDEVEKNLQTSISEDDILSITLEPVKISDNSGSYHVDCSVNVVTKGVVQAKYHVMDAGGTEFVTQEIYNFIANKGETSPAGSYAETKTYNGHTYTFSGWYDNEACTGTPITFPQTVGDSTLNFYAKYVRSDLKYTVKYLDADTGKEVSPTKTSSANSDGQIVVEKAVDVKGYSVDAASKSLTITEDGDNTIIFYYTAKKGHAGYYLAIEGAQWPNGMPADLESNGKDSAGKANKYRYTYGFAKGDTFTVIDDVPVADGYAFIGWLDKARSGSSSVVTAGDTVTYTYNGDQDYTLDALWASLVTEGYEGTYDGASHTIKESIGINEGSSLKDEYKAQALNHITQGAVEYSTDGVNWSTTNPSFTDVGTYTVYVRQAVTVGDNTTTLTGQATVKINPVAIAVYKQETKTYNGSEQSIDLNNGTKTGLIDGETLTLTGATISGTEVGAYNKVADNYTWSVAKADGSNSTGNYTISVSGQLEITKAGDFGFVNLDTNNYEGFYDGQRHGTVATTNATTGTTKIEYSTDGGKTWSETVPTILDFGEIAVQVRATNSNYSNTAEGSYTLKVNKKAITVNKETSLTYTGSEQTINIAGGTVDGVVPGETLTLTGATISGTEAGEYTTVTEGYKWSVAKGDGSNSTDNYTITVTGKLTITQADEFNFIDVDALSKSQTYNGVALTSDEPKVNAATGTTAFTYQVWQDGAWVTVDEAPSRTDAGVTKVKVTAHNSNYKNEPSAEYELTVNKAEITVSKETSVDYDGTEKSIDLAEGTITGVVASEKLTLTGATISGTEAGKYTDVATGWAWSVAKGDGTDSKGNYTIKVSGTLTITKAKELAFMDLDKNGYEGTYDAAYHGSEATTNAKSGETTIQYSTDNGTTWSDEVPRILDAGTINVMVKATNPNYENEATGSYTLTVNPAPLTVKTGSDTKVYDGTALTKDEASIEGLQGGETAGVSATGSQITVGTSSNGYSITWAAEGNTYTAKQPNYTVTTELGTLTVTPQSIEPTDPSYNGIQVGQLESVYYNGSSQKQTPAVTDKNGNELVATDYEVSWSEDTTNAGTVTVTIKGKGNYTGTVTREYKILPRTVYVDTNTASKVYDGTVLTGTAEARAAEGNTGFVAGEGATFKALEIGPAVTAQTSNTWSFVSWTGNAKAGNYEIMDGDLGTLEITAQNINPGTDPENPDPSYSGVQVGTPDDVVYNGTSQQQEPTVTDKDGNVLTKGTDYTLSWSEDTTNAGTVTVTVKGMGNYTGEVKRTYKITKRTVYVDTDTQSKPYDGTKLVGTATVKPEVATADTGLVNGETLSVSATTIGPDVTTETKNAYTVDWTKSTAQRRNYTVEDGTLGTLEITTAKLDGITCDKASDVTYNGSEQTFVPIVKDTTLNKTLTADTDYEVSYSTTDRTNVTGEIIVTVAGKGNYEGYTFTTSYQVLPKEVTVTTGSAEKVYDGTALTKDEASVEGIVAGETYVVHATGTQTAVGSSSNTYEITWAAEGNEYTAKESNYSVKTPESLGTLKVTEKSIVPVDPDNPDPESDPKKISCNDPSDSVYDGADHKWAPTLTDPETGKTLELNKDYTLSYSTGDFKNAGSITVTITGKGNYTGEFTKTYKITPREVTVTAASASKKYDGTALTNDGWSVAEATDTTGMVASEKIESVKVTGSQTYVGESDNVASDAVFAAGVVAANYSVKYQSGKLTVTDGKDDDKVDPTKVIAKTHDSSKQYKLGDTVEFTITAKNIYAEAKTMTFSEQEGVTITGQSVFENVQPGDEVSTTATYTIAEKDILAGKFTNTAKVTFEGGKSFDGTDTVEDGEIEGKNAHLTVTKITTNNVDKAKIFQVGETIEYSVVVENDGNVTISNVAIDDQLAGVVLVSDTGETKLAPGAKRTATYKYTVTQVDVDTGKSIVNNATATGTDPDGKTPGVVPGETTDAIPTQKASVSANKSASATGLSTGEETYYTITITNNGNVTLNNIYVYECKDNVIAKYAVDAAGNNISVTNESAKPTKYRDYKSVAKLDSSFTLAPGESVKVVYEAYTVTEDDVIAGAVRNMAYAGGHYTNNKGKDKTVDVSASNSYYTNANPDLSITKEVVNAKDTYKAGDTITYKLTVKNDGNLTLTNVKVTDELEGAKLTSGEESIASLGLGESKELTYEYTVTEGDVVKGKVTNLATGTADSPNGKKLETSDEVTSKTETATPSLDVVKTTTSTMPEGGYAAGDTIEYKITVTNNGNLTVKDITVTDELTGNGTENPLDTNLTLAPSASKEYTASYTVTEADTLKGATITNVAVAKGTASDGSTVEKTGTKEDTNVKGTNGIDVEKTVTNKGTGENGAFKLGDKIEYQIVVTNTGNTTLSNVTVTDELLSKNFTIEGTLAPGESKTFKNSTSLLDSDSGYDYTVTDADIVAGKVVNTVDVSAKVDADGTTITDTDSTDTNNKGGDDGKIVDYNAHLTVDKTTTSTPAEGNTYKVGETIEYTVTVTNDGTVTIKNVAIDDQLKGVEYVSGDTTAESLAPGESITAKYKYTVTQDDVDNNAEHKIVNNATAKGTDPKGDEPEVKPGETEDPIPSQEPALTVVKTADKTSGVKAGDVITYTVTVTNTGNVTIDNVVVEDGLEGAVLKGDTGETKLAPGAQRTATYEYVVTESDVIDGSVTNIATATGEDPKGGEVSGDGTATVDTEKKNVHYSIKKETTSEDANKDGKYALGETIKYKVTVTNDGNITLSNIKVTDQLSGAKLTSGSETIETLVPGDSKVLTYEYVVTEADVIAGSVVNVATAKGESPDPDTPEPEPEPGKDEEKTDDAKGSLVVTKNTISKPADGTAYAAGETITYEVSAENTGNVTLTDVVITDALTGAEWNVGTLKPGEKTQVYETSYEVTEADTLKGTTITNVATATAKTPENVPDPEITPGETTDTNVEGTTGIKVEKTVTNVGQGSGDNGAFALGDEIEYSITVTNTGNTTLTNYQFSDPLIGKTDTIETFAVGATATYTGKYKVTEDDIRNGSVVNTARAAATVKADGSTVTDSDSTDTNNKGTGDDGTIVDKKSHLTVVKTTTNKPANGATYVAGEDIEYSVTVTNDGNQTITNVAIDDQLKGVEYVSGDTNAESLAPGESITANYKYTVTQDDVDNSTTHKIVNNATATGTDPENKNPEVTPGKTEDSIPSQEPALTVVKTADKTSDVKLGETVTYTVTVTNVGNVTMKNVTVEDGLEGATLKSDSGETTLAPNAKRTVVYEYTVTEADVIKGSVTNVATAQGTDPQGNEKSYTGTETIDTEDAKATYSIEKITVDKDVDATGTLEDGSKAYKAGDTIHYEIKVTNTGNTTLKNLKVVDPLTGLEKSKEELAVNTTWTLETSHLVTEADVIKGKVLNEATVSGESPDPVVPDPDPTPGTDEEETEEAKGSLVVTKTTESTPANGTAYAAGETITYKLVATNTGNVKLSNVVVTDELTGDAGEAAWNIGELEAGKSAEKTVTYTVTEADTLKGTTIHNVATATAQTPEGVDDPTITPGEKDESNVEGTTGIQVVKGVSNTGTGEGGKFQLGDTIRYAISVANTGNTTLTDVVVEDANLGLTGENALTVGELKAGETKVLSDNLVHVVTDADIVAGSVTNTAVASGKTALGETISDESTVTTGNGGSGGDIVDYRAHLTVDKTATSTPANGRAYLEGESITYSITVTNDGTVNLTNVVAKDEKLNWTSGIIANLAPGQSETFEVSHEVTAEDVAARSYVNDATAEGTQPDGGDDPTITPDEETVPTGGNGALISIAKTTTSTAANGSTYLPGETIEYSITATNNGDLAAKNVVITDALTGEEWSKDSEGLTDEQKATLENFEPGATVTFTTSYVVTDADAAAGTVANTATGTAEKDDPSDPDPTVTPDTETDPVAPAPVTPVTPDTPTTPTTPTTPATPTLPEPLNTVVNALETIAAPVAAAVEEATGAAPEVIDDEGTPLAGRTAHHCWVHFYIILGIIITLIYVAAVIIRRVRFGQKVHDYDDDMLDKGKKGTGTDEVAAPTANLGVQPTMAQGSEA